MQRRIFSKNLVIFIFITCMCLFRCDAELNVTCGRNFFSDISERNKDYSDTLDFRRGLVGSVTFFVLEVSDYEATKLIYLYIYIYG